MATLVLTAVGTAVGGPIGGAIGAIIGQQIDQRIFAPKARHGPRLGDLAVQTSSYGSADPEDVRDDAGRRDGDLVDRPDRKPRRPSGGGKGRPKTVNYTYSASFAVALSARPMLGVGRIWADGKLLRGAAGDFKSATGFRLHPGGEDQAADPLIAAAEGAGIGAGLSRHRLCGVRGFPARGLRQPDPVADLRGRGRCRARSRSARSPRR